jgi:VanZ family protein
VNRWLLLLVTVVWWAIVLFSSGGGASGDWSKRLLHELLGLSGQALEVTNFVLRKFCHVAYYFALTGLLAASLRKFFNQGLRRDLIGAVVLGLGTGVFDEARQSLSPGRTGTAFDLIYDGAGIFLMALIYWTRCAKA